MPFTTGNDTVSLTFDGTNIDGLAGDDLLTLTIPSTFNGFPVWFFELRAVTDEGTWRLAYYPDSTGASWVILNGSIRNIERFDLTTSPSAISGLPTSPNVHVSFETGNGNDTLRGNDGDDYFRAGGGANLVYGGFGDDRIYVHAGDGADRIYAGADNDNVFAEGLDDIIDGGTGFDTLDVTLAASSTPFEGNISDIYANPNWTRFERINITLTDQDDLVRATTLSGTLYGGNGHDVLILNGQGLSRVNLNMDDYYSVSGFEQLRFLGSAGNDTVSATNGDDTISGGAGNDIISAGSYSAYIEYGNDIVYGGSGDDVIGRVGYNDTVYGGAGHDIANVDLILAPEGVVLGRGNNLPNFVGIEEYSGRLTQFDDIFYSSSITPGMDAGWGNDRIVLDHSRLPGQTSHTVIRMDATSLMIARYVDDVSNGGVDLFGWEELYYAGSRGSDSVVAYHGNDDLRGGRGDDTLNGGGGNDTLFGGEGDDLLILSATGQTRASGDSGNDLFNVAGTGHRLYGGSGNDVFRTVGPGNIIDGGRGIDRVEFDMTSLDHGVDMTIRGPEGTWRKVESFVGTLTDHDDTATMGFLTNGSRIDGGDGNDTLLLNYSAPGLAFQIVVEGLNISISMADASIFDAGFGSFEIVQIVASEGNDVISATAASVGLYGLGGDDRLTGVAGRDVLEGGQGSDTLDGQDGIDTLRGGLGVDIILGAGGDDLIEGGDDGDGIAGEGGDDDIYGGLGADLFYFEGAIDSGADRIHDYAEGIDQIWISGGLTARNVRMADVGADKLVTWANGSVLLDGMAGQAVHLYFDADFA